jgi:hypothetical protein
MKDIMEVKGKGKAVPVQAQIGPVSCRRFRLTGFSDNRCMKVLMLLILCTGWFYPQGRSPVLISVRG